MRYLVLGAGFLGSTVARALRARGESLFASTAEPTRAAQLRSLGATVCAERPLRPEHLRGALEEGSRVLVCFPPEEATDRWLAPALAGHPAVYVSTTGVYGRATGHVDEDTPVDPEDPRARPRLEAEARYRGEGALVLRPAGIYGPGRGLHLRVARGVATLTEDGSGVVSRVHVEDLASLCLCALERGAPGALYVAADEAPVPQREALAWLCERLGAPPPRSVPRDAAAPSLRHDRSVDSARARRELGWRLRYPSYREGFAQCLEAEGLTPR